jgi:hypothetical protein
MERRSGKDRRKHIDPRYQSAAYPEFVDRRSGVDGRKRSYHDLPGHPTRKLIIVMGVVVTLFIISLFFLTSLLLTEKCGSQNMFRLRQSSMLSTIFHLCQQAVVKVSPCLFITPSTRWSTFPVGWMGGHGRRGQVSTITNFVKG